jgi:tetratricopeptide (TPR) repeat protein
MNFLIGQKLVAQKEFGKALDIFLNLKDKNDLTSFYLGLIYFELNNLNKSIYYYNKFLKKKPNSIVALYNLAFVKQSIGELEAAKNIYLKLIEIDKNKIRPFYGLFTLDPNYLGDHDFDKILEIQKNYSNSLFEEGIINYLLSKKEKKNKKFSKEIEYLKNSHDLIFKSKKQNNISSQFYYNKIISKFYDKIKFINNHNNKFNNDKIIPIFIVGMPRSGSTLVEAILSSGSENINSLGECHVANISILEQIGAKIYTKDFDIKKFSFEINLKSFNDSVLRRYKQFNLNKTKDHQIIIDKSLENFFNIESILKIFPNAKFLHTFRNPSDSIISIFQSMLAELSWTHSFDDILNYYDNYHKIMNFYKNRFPKSIMDIDLEKFTNNSNHISKEIYEFCGLKWRQEVLEFYKRNNLHSKTLSFAQIRNEVSKYNVSKYRPYLHLLNKYKTKFEWLNT